jgi:hypothetical protein
MQLRCFTKCQKCLNAARIALRASYIFLNHQQLQTQRTQCKHSCSGLLLQGWWWCVWGDAVPSGASCAVRLAVLYMLSGLLAVMLGHLHPTPPAAAAAAPAFPAAAGLVVVGVIGVTLFRLAPHSVLLAVLYLLTGLLAVMLPRLTPLAAAAAAAGLSVAGFAAAAAAAAAGLVVVGVIGVTLFPLAPHSVRLAVLYILSGLLAVMLGTMALRYVVWAAVWLGTGAHFWLLPNMMSEEVGSFPCIEPLLCCGIRLVSGSCCHVFCGVGCGVDGTWCSLPAAAQHDEQRGKKRQVCRKLVYEVCNPCCCSFCEMMLGTMALRYVVWVAVWLANRAQFWLLPSISSGEVGIFQ